MWFSGFFFLILSLIVEVYLWWKLQASLIFLSGRTCTIVGWLYTFLPHCKSCFEIKCRFFFFSLKWQKYEYYLIQIPLLESKRKQNSSLWAQKWMTNENDTLPLQGNFALYPPLNKVNVWKFSSTLSESFICFSSVNSIFNSMPLFFCKVTVFPCLSQNHIWACRDFLLICWMKIFQPFMSESVFLQWQIRLSN